MSKKIWGEGVNELVKKPKSDRKSATKTPKGEAANRSAGRPKAKPLLEPSALLAELPESGKHDDDDLDEDDMKKGLTLIGELKRKELEGKWKILRHSEMELFVNRSCGAD
ncbi:unnamed protein product [Sphenostylis stenocarpa]|uniref:Uncharacterized protein n=1 Tax=Sphenostylis stenocarpa TaxID=92480 RepID=A0AA86W174_9FABA|nr:unnamed protein product [Sphenostylis stenocarpa]